ncbi:copper homeostasis protein CutC [Paenibacillus alvei]|uniref:PF03932 family protein CutC n=1 Tax=Paenibacillus alvei TaxID=44250 RepID=A0AAP7DHP4_PAEAL|nr:copper homeostasis protein CutC [Paenibacillus alvei]NOJ70015.1 copper homeostasis protein CutC [Paenibacillus alvei]
MNSILLEVIGTTVQEVKEAALHGADRIELITAFSEGGLTPSLGLIEEAVASVSIPVNVMVRPHSRSFVYDKDDQATILRDIRLIRETGANAIVFGALTPEGKVDDELLERVLDAAGEIPLTFHRAIDQSSDLLQALDVLLAYPQVTTVLTSGGEPSALQGLACIQAMVQAAGSSLEILAGSGLTAESVVDFVRKAGVKQVHFGSNVRIGGHALAPIDPERLRALRASLNTITV